MDDLDYPITIEHREGGHVTIGSTKIPADIVLDDYTIDPAPHGTQVTLTLFTTGPVQIRYPAKTHEA